MPVLRPNAPAVTRARFRLLPNGPEERGIERAGGRSIVSGMAEPHDILRALRGGPATLDALAARLGGGAPERDALTWAVDDAVARGWVASTAGADCGPDGLCGTSAPTVFTLTPAGRSAAAPVR